MDYWIVTEDPYGTLNINKKTITIKKNMKRSTKKKKVKTPKQQNKIRKSEEKRKRRTEPKEQNKDNNKHEKTHKSTSEVPCWKPTGQKMTQGKEKNAACGQARFGGARGNAGRKRWTARVARTIQPGDW